MIAKKNIVTAALVAALGMAAGSAQAGLVAHSDVNGLATFQDTTTGRVWLKLPALFSMNYATQVSTASAAGFSVATLSDVSALWNSTPGSSWADLAVVIGDSSSRSLMWGNYAFGGVGNPNGYAYAYGGTSGHWDNYNPNSGAGYSDLGLWAFQTGGTLPEPASLALVGIALAGVSLARRARKA